MLDHLASDESDRQVAAVIYLMSCHARTRCPRLAAMVEKHLAMIGKHPGTGEHVRDTCRKLAAAWSCVRARNEREAAAEGATSTRACLH